MRHDCNSAMPGRVEIQCAECGHPKVVERWRVKRNRNLFCSRSCSQAYQRKHPNHPTAGKKGTPSEMRKCRACGKVFRAYAARKMRDFCSRECRMSKTQVKKACPRCGKGFSVNRSRADARVYCSEECYRPPVEIVCKRCGKTFVRSHANQNRVYCSEECYRPPIVQECDECHKPFRIEPSKVGIRRFCSFACYRKFTGETSPERSVRLCLESLGVIYIQEHQVRTYSLDFYLPDLHIGIEVDEPYWHDRIAAKDRRRDRTLTAMGYRIIRLNANPFYGTLNERMVEIVRSAIHDDASPHVRTARKSSAPKLKTLYVQQSLLE